MLKKLIMVLCLCLIFINIENIHALSVEKKELTLSNGDSENIDLYVNLNKPCKEINFSLVFSTYDIPAYFKTLSDYKLTTSGITNKVDLKEYKEGKVKVGTINVRVVDNPKLKEGKVNISNAYCYNKEGDKIKLNSPSLKINVQEDIDADEENDDSSCLLKEIKSKIVEIKLEKDVFTYTVNVPSNITQLDLEAVAYSDDAIIEVSSQNINSRNDEIKIVVSNKDKEQEYVIKVIKEVSELSIDETKIEVSQQYKIKWVIVIVALIGFLIGAMVIHKIFL